MKALCVHSKRHAWWFWFMWHRACSESWNERTEKSGWGLRLTQRLDSLTSHSRTITFSGSFFLRIFPVFPSQVWPDPRFPPSCFSVFRVSCCRFVPVRTRRLQSSSYMLQHAATERWENQVFGQVYHFRLLFMNEDNILNIEGHWRPQTQKKPEKVHFGLVFRLAVKSG